MADWQALRASGSAIRQNALDHLDSYLIQFEEACIRSGGQVHWAFDAAEANRIAVDLVKAHDADEVLKIKSMTTQEIGLNESTATLPATFISGPSATANIEMMRIKGVHGPRSLDVLTVNGQHGSLPAIS